jgi:hypothetical protein
VLIHHRARQCGDVASPHSPEPVLSFGLAVTTRPWRAFDWRIWRHDAVAPLPGLAPQWLARDLLPLAFDHSSRNNKIARPAILRSAVGLKAAGQPSWR